MTPIDCESRIERVVVYARGAVVTRSVELPAVLPEGPLDLRVFGLTAIAEAGSLRAIAHGDREVTALRPKLAIPSTPARPGRLKSEVRAFSFERQRLEAERTLLAFQRTEIGARVFDLSFSRWAKRSDPSARFADALSVSDLLGAELGRIDARLRELDEAIEDNKRRAHAAELELSQGTSAELSDEDQTKLDVILRLGPAEASPARGDAGKAGLEVEYVVAAARFWPAYTARFSAQATRVSFTIDAFVAQASGEDWTRAKLSVSTADLAQDARLPELRSLRIGRAQPAPRRGYRPPPAGLDAMFEGYDRALALLVAGGASAPPDAKVARAFQCRNILWDTFEGLSNELDCSVDYLINEAMRQYTLSRSYSPRTEEDDSSESTLTGSIRPTARALGRGAPPAPLGYAPPASGGAPPPQGYARPARGGALPPAASFGAAAPLPPSAPAAMSLSMSAPMAPPPMQQEMRRTRMATIATATPQSVSGGFALDPPLLDLGAVADEDEASLDDGAIEPGDAWLDFDALMLADPKDRGRRGRLMHDKATALGARSIEARATIEALEGPPEARDPLTTRGRFDHRYDAEGVADVPSNGRPHRVAIATAEASAKPRFVAVPREAAEVYREAEIQNPFAAPLLSGPVEVFIDGALLTTSSLSFVDRRGVLHLGLGVEDRLRVARNVRVQEASAGLLGGSTAIEHTVTIDVASSLGQKVAVEVIDRVPVTDDKDIDVKILSTKPEADKYTQAERGEPIRRGLRFSIEVPPGDKQRIEFAYRVTLSAKNELVGGNRRE